MARKIITSSIGAVGDIEKTPKCKLNSGPRIPSSRPCRPWAGFSLVMTKNSNLTNQHITKSAWSQLWAKKVKPPFCKKFSRNDNLARARIWCTLMSEDAGDLCFACIFQERETVFSGARNCIYQVRWDVILCKFWFCAHFWPKVERPLSKWMPSKMPKMPN